MGINLPGELIVTQSSLEIEAAANKERRQRVVVAGFPTRGPGRKPFSPSDGLLEPQGVLL